MMELGGVKFSWPACRSAARWFVVMLMPRAQARVRATNDPNGEF
jgi:hypothetical protein